MINYTYNADGVRIGKSGAKTAAYTVCGTQILSENNGSNTTYYLYDENGSPVGLTYKGTTYYYRKNLQWDIINITDSTGAKVVTYTYNAWGKIMSMTGNMELAVNNPFRYRGYYYDVESGLYYLNSRYYDPQTGRFINADDTYFLIIDQGTLIQYNLFSYCHNNPTNMTDINGNIPFFVITGIIGAIAGGIIGYATTGSWQGAVAGVAIGGAIGLTGGAAAGKILAGSVVANTSAVIAGGKALFATASTVVASSWQQAEQLLRKAYNGVRQAISTPYGRRVVDSLSGKFARESKYGYQSLSVFIKKEIMKDAYLISNGYKVEWHFYWSQASNSGGPSRPLRRALEEAGIKIVEHFRR